jgi:hypothetical protein
VKSDVQDLPERLRRGRTDEDRPLIAKRDFGWLGDPIMSETIRKVLSSTDFDEPRHAAHASPYPGLRPFRPDKNELFFGRESQIDSLAEKLARNRFVAVVGPSGCGKSSLVQAGLLPEVQLGLLPGAEAGCRMAILRPGARPLAALAEAVIRMDELEAEQSSPELVRKIGALYATLRRGDRGLIEVVRQLSFQPDTEC